MHGARYGTKPGSSGVTKTNHILLIFITPDITHWVVNKNQVKSIGSHWISLTGLFNKKTRFEMGKSLYGPEKKWANLFGTEPRTGIGIDSTRRVEKGKLFTARHIRLQEGASLIWGVSQDCGLEKQGVLSLGGEQRFGTYEELNHIPCFPKSGDQYIALSPVLVSENSRAALIGTGKIIYRGGWDLVKQFHKDMQGYYPAGSVFR